MHATPEEVLLAIERLSAADHLQLRRAARLVLPGSAFGDPIELVTDAIHTAFLAASGEGGRRWRTDVPFQAYLVNTIRGLASDSRRTLRAREVLRDVFDPGDGESVRSQALVIACLEQSAAEQEDKEWREAQQDAQLGRVMDFFREDPEVCWIISGLREGIPSREVQARSGMTATQYASAHRRWRRGLQRLFPGRRQSS